MTLTTDHRLVSRILIEQAQSELDSGDLIQASEKAWGATARALKAIAKRRGLRHNGHYDFYRIIRQLEETTGRKDLRTRFQIADALHGNFYNGWMPEADVTTALPTLGILSPTCTR